LSSIKEIIVGALEYFYEGKKPYLLKFEKYNKNIEISKKIMDETNKFMIN